MKRLSTLAAVAAIAAVPTLAQAQTFTYTTIDNPGDPTFNELLGIDDSGAIVGYFGSGMQGHPNIGYEIAPPYAAFQSNMKPGSVQTQATGINGKGLTTGFWSDTNTGDDANFGFVRLPVGRKFEYISIDAPEVAGIPHVTQILGINSSNVVAGYYNNAAGSLRGFTYSLTTAEFSPIEIKHAASVAATAINDSGVVAGFCAISGVTEGFVRNASGSRLIKFGVPGSGATQFLGINNSGVAVGYYLDVNSIPHGVYYQSTTRKWVQVDQPNGVMGTVVNGINNKSQIVGYYTDAAGNVHGMLANVNP